MLYFTRVEWGSILRIAYCKGWGYLVAWGVQYSCQMGSGSTGCFGCPAWAVLGKALQWTIWGRGDVCVLVHMYVFVSNACSHIYLSQMLVHICTSIILVKCFHTYVCTKIMLQMNRIGESVNKSRTSRIWLLHIYVCTNIVLEIDRNGKLANKRETYYVNSLKEYNCNTNIHTKILPQMNRNCESANRRETSRA